MAARRKLAVEEIILMQSMFAEKNIRAQRDRLMEFKIQLLETPIEAAIVNRTLQFELQLQHTPGDPMEMLPFMGECFCLDDRPLQPQPELQLQQTAGEPIDEVLPGFDEVKVSITNRLKLYELERQQNPREAPEGYSIEEVLSGLDEVCFHGLEAAVGYLNLCLDRAAQNGARLAPNPSFSDEQKLFDALAAAKRLPARPTTQAEALSRVQAAMYAVKLSKEHLLPRCIDHLKATGLAPPAATPKAAGSSSSMEQARTALDDAYIVVNLAIKHIELAIAAISPFVHPKEVADSSRFADNYTTFGWSVETVTMKRLLKPKR